MRDNLILFYVVAGTVALLVGLGKGGLGGTLGVLTTPLMSLVMPVSEVVGLILPLLILGDVFAVSVHLRRWDTSLYLRLIPGAVVGIFLGTFVLTAAPPLVLRRGLGVLVLLFVGYKIYEERILKATIYHPRAWHGVATGGVAAFTSTVANAGGPPIAVYLLLQKLQPRTYVATSALYFATINLVKVPFYLYAHVFNAEQLARIVFVLPMMPVGVLLGRAFAVRIPRRPFELLILALLVMSAVLLLVTG